MSAPRPTLDLIVADPRVAANLSAETAHELMAEIAVAQSTLVARLLALDGTAAKAEAPTAAPDDEWLTVEEAAKLIRRVPQWIWRHKKTLPWVRVVSRKSLLCSKNGIAKWLAQAKVKS